jgi:type IV pilus assembly protein PilM
MSRIRLTIEISDQELKILVVSCKPYLTKRFQEKKLNLDLIPIPTGVIEQGILRDKEVLLGLLQTYLTKRELVGPIPVNLLIPSQLGFIRAYRLPWVPKADRASAIGFLVEEEVPIPAADLLYDYLILENNRKNNVFQFLIGATRGSLIQDYVHVFQQAGLEVDKIDFVISALGYALGLNNNEEFICLQAENNTLQFILFNGIIPEVVRTFLADPALAFSEVDWESEIQRVLLCYGSQHPGISLRKIYIIGEGMTELIAERLEKTGLVSRITKADFGKIPDSWRKYCQTWPENTKIVLNYALRNQGKGPGINLWRKQVNRKRKDFFFKINVISFVLVLMTGFLIWLPLQNRENRLQNETEQLRSKGRQLLSSAEQQTALSKAWIAAREYPFYFGEKLAEIQRLLPYGVELTNLEYKEGGLSLQGTTDNAEKFEELLAALTASGLERPLLTTYQKTDRAAIKFVIKTGFGFKEKAASKS